MIKHWATYLLSSIQSSCREIYRKTNNHVNAHPHSQHTADKHPIPCIQASSKIPSPGYPKLYPTTSSSCPIPPLQSSPPYPSASFPVHGLFLLRKPIICQLRLCVNEFPWGELQNHFISYSYSLFRMRGVGYLRRLMPNLRYPVTQWLSTILRFIVDKLTTMNHELIIVIHALRATYASQSQLSRRLRPSNWPIVDKFPKTLQSNRLLERRVHSKLINHSPILTLYRVGHESDDDSGLKIVLFLMPSYEK